MFQIIQSCRPCLPPPPVDYPVRPCTMSDSDSEIQLERTFSFEKDSDYDIVPEDTTFILKLKNTANKTYRALEYKLKQGKSLPYSVLLKGSFLFYSSMRVGDNI